MLKMMFVQSESVANPKLTSGHVAVVLWQSDFGLGVDIYSPWSKGGEYDYDITMNDFTNNRLSMACTGEDDYYCSVGVHEAQVFAWEIQLACCILQNWKQFWSDPTSFLCNMKCPYGNYPVVLKSI